MAKRKRNYDDPICHPDHSRPVTRRDFLSLLAAVPAVLAGGWTRRRTGRARPEHPTPRPGITAARVPTAEQLRGERADVIAAFDEVRRIPGVVDGIACQCGCAELEEMYSLLSCFEGEHAMARHCVFCRDQGRLAFRMHEAGATLDEIRRAVVEEYG